MNHLIVFTISLAWLAIFAGAWLGWQLLRQNGRLLLRLEELEKRLNELEFSDPTSPAGLPLDSTAPEFELLDLSGKSRKLADFRGQPLLLIFFNPACGYCRDLAPKLVTLSEMRDQAEPNPDLAATTAIAGPGQNAVAAEAPQNAGDRLAPQVLIISTGDAEWNRKLLDEHKLVCAVLLQKESEVASAYQANGTPSGYLISPQGRIASELAIGANTLLELVAGKSEVRSAKIEAEQDVDSAPGGTGDGIGARFRARSLARSKIKRDGLKAGTTAPEFRLPRLDGRGELSLQDFRGRRVLLVFSSPNCGPCLALAPHLEKFHRAHPELDVVMISKGEPKENRAKVKEHGLTFPIVLQQQWEISRLYAMFATPIAYMVDQAGVISHDVAVGVESIQTLLAKGAKGPLETPQI